MRNNNFPMLIMVEKTKQTMIAVKQADLPTKHAFKVLKTNFGVGHSNRAREAPNYTPYGWAKMKFRNGYQLTLAEKYLLGLGKEN